MVNTKSELDKSGLAPSTVTNGFILDTLCVRNRQRTANFNQSEGAMSLATASAIFFRNMKTDFRGNGYSKNRLIRGSDGEPYHAITTQIHSCKYPTRRVAPSCL